MFGVTNERLNLTHVYLFQHKDIKGFGKGSETVISCLYDYIKKYLIKWGIEKLDKLVIFADNCAG